MRAIYPAIPLFTPMSEGALRHVSVQEWAAYRLAEWQYNHVLKRREAVHCFGIAAVTIAIMAVAIFAYAASL